MRSETHVQTKVKKHKPKSRPQILAMGMIGAGLLLLGVLAIVLLPKSGANANTGNDSGVSTTPARVDYTAPALSLDDLDGKKVSLADYRGEVVLVNNWATWCPPCKAEMPTLQAYYSDHHKQNFTIVGIEAGDASANVASFVKQFGLSFPVWPDPNQESLRAFRNMSLPNSYVIDKTGKVRLAWTGAISRDMLEKYVTPLLEE